MAKLALVGEAWGVDEERLHTPFVGAAGRMLDEMLVAAGLSRSDAFITNVFNFRPPNNDLTALCGEKSERLPDFPSLNSGKYVRAEYASELERLADELRRERPNLVVALGATASWALLRDTRISKIRGCCAWSEPNRVKVLPTYHPAAVLREYPLRAIAVLDLQKARFEQEFPELRRPLRRIYYDPSLSELPLIYEKAKSAKYISADIENNQLEITCIGFAFDITEAYVIPFVDSRKPGGHYWASPGEEVAAWRAVKAILALPNCKVGQNFLYDLQHLWMRYGVAPNMARSHDTMLLHHSLQPELEKGLGFLGSVYCNDLAWKEMRPRGKHSIKREE